MRCPTCGSEVPSGFKFCGQCGTKLDEAPAAAESRSDAPAAQRREVAVLFADVSGFTAMSEKLDAEDVHDVMNRCFAGLGAVIQEEGGYIDKYIGDNVMALFGAPVAHEDDPARACRAALGIHHFLNGFSEEFERKCGVKLRMRIGISYGLVLAGGVGSDVKMDYTVMGDTVNLASRLESAAAPGTVLVSEDFFRQARADFEFGPVIELKVKGKEELVRAYELLGEATSACRIGASVAPFVARTDEMVALRNRIDATSGRGRWIEVRGQIGIGKSRLVRELFARLGERRLIHVVATPATARRPFAMVRRLLMVSFAEVLEEKLETPEGFAATLHALSPRLDLYEKALWYVVAPSRLAVAPPDEDPLSFRRTIERGIFVFLRALIRRFPDTFFFLDAYDYVDEASAGLLRGRDEGGAPVPMITALRHAEGTAAVDDQSAIVLGPLDDQEAGELLEKLTCQAEVPESFRKSILRRAAGVPLFIEEIVRALIEEGGFAPTADGKPSLKVHDDAVKLPSSLRAAMVSRLDRLQQAEREIIGYCSVQGVEFGIAAVERVSGLRGNHDATRLLQNLRAHGIIRDVITASVPSAAFAQPLMQEACYQMLLRRERRELHDVTARVLCELAGGTENVAPEVLVFHFEHAEQWEAAGAANLRAANRAADLFLNEKALADYNRVLTNLEKAGAGSEKARRLRLLAHMGAAEVHARMGAYPAAEQRANALLTITMSDAERSEGWRILAMIHARTGRADEAQKLLSQAVAHGLRGEFPNPEMLSLAWYGLAELHQRAGRMEEALEALRRCRAAAVAQTRTSLRAELLEGVIAHTRGQFSDAKAHYRCAFDLAVDVGTLAERARAINQLGNVARDEGDYHAAQKSYRDALGLWIRIGDTECIAGGHNNLGNLALSRGHFTAARVHYEESLAACVKIGNVHGVALAHANLGILALDENDGESAILAARASLAVLSGAANDILRGLVESVLGEGHLLAGEIDQAEECFRKVLLEFSESSHPLAVAYALRGSGRVAAACGAVEMAEECFARAITYFKQLNRTQEKARTMLDEARLFLKRSDLEAARARALTALDRFTAIGAQLDAERANSLLTQLDPPAAEKGG